MATGYGMAVAGVSPGTVWVTAVLAALAYAVLSARRDGLNPRLAYWVGIVGIVAGLWGGHLLGIFYYGTDGRPWAWLRFWSGGQAQYGGLIAGALAVVVFLKLRRLPVLLYADAIAPGIALGVAIGRIGCFLNGDDFGTLSNLPWAVRFPPGTLAYAAHLERGWITAADGWSLPVHPVQLYCSLLWACLFVFLVWLPAKQPGLRFSVLLIAHGIGRLGEQFFRGDFQCFLGPFSLTQIISLLLIAVGTAIWLGSCRRVRSVDTLVSASAAAAVI